MDEQELRESLSIKELAERCSNSTDKNHRVSASKHDVFTIRTLAM
jgi:hypothetical protein